MRICLINEFFYPDNTGGTGNVLSDLMQALRREHDDLEIDVVTSRNLYRRPLKIAQQRDAGSKAWQGKLFRFAAPPAESLQSGLASKDCWQNIRIFRLATPHPNNRPLPMRLLVNLAFTFAALMFLLRRSRYDLVVVATAPPMAALAAYIHRLLKGTPYIYIIYDLEPDRAVSLNVVSQRSPFALAFRQMQRKCLRAAARVVVLGRCMKTRIAGAYGLDPALVDVVPIGFDPTSVWPMSRQSRFRAEHGLAGKFVVLYSGNLGRYHDFDTVLDAAKQVAAVRDDVRFVIVGGGYQKEHIEKRVAEEGIESIALYDFVAKEDLSDLLATADLSLVTLEPSMEGLCVPSKFYTIMSSGRPVLAIVSAETEMSWAIEEAGCGIRIDHKNAAQLVEAVLRFADDPETLERMGVSGRKSLIENYSTEHVARLFCAVLCAAKAGSGVSAPRPKRRDAEKIEINLQ